MDQNKLPRLQHRETNEVELVKERLYERKYLTRVPEWENRMGEMEKSQRHEFSRPVIKHESRYRKPNIYQNL